MILGTPSDRFLDLAEKLEHHTPNGLLYLMSAILGIVFGRLVFYIMKKF